MSTETQNQDGDPVDVNMDPSFDPPGGTVDPDLVSQAVADYLAANPLEEGELAAVALPRTILDFSTTPVPGMIDVPVGTPLMNYDPLEDGSPLPAGTWRNIVRFTSTGPDELATEGAALGGGDLGRVIRCFYDPAGDAFSNPTERIITLDTITEAGGYVAYPWGLNEHQRAAVAQMITNALSGPATAALWIHSVFDGENENDPTLDGSVPEWAGRIMAVGRAADSSLNGFWRLGDGSAAERLTGSDTDLNGLSLAFATNVAPQRVVVLANAAISGDVGLWTFERVGPGESDWAMAPGAMADDLTAQTTTFYGGGVEAVYDVPAGMAELRVDQTGGQAAIRIGRNRHHATLLVTVLDTTEGYVSVLTTDGEAARLNAPGYWLLNTADSGGGSVIATVVAAVPGSVEVTLADFSGQATLSVGTQVVRCDGTGDLEVWVPEPLPTGWNDPGMTNRLIAFFNDSATYNVDVRDKNGGDRGIVLGPETRALILVTSDGIPHQF